MGYDIASAVRLRMIMDKIIILVCMLNKIILFEC